MGVGDVEVPRRAAAVGGKAEMGRREQQRGERVEVGPERPDTFDQGDEGGLVRRAVAQAAAVARGRTVTSTDFEVGVSLSRPKVESGTSTFSSG